MPYGYIFVVTKNVLASKEEEIHQLAKEKESGL